MKIRTADRNDLAAIRDLHIRSWRDAYATLLPADYLARQIEVDFAAKWSVLDPNDIVLVGECEGRIVAFAAIRPDHASGPFLDNFHVDPHCRSGGFGFKMFEEIRARLRARGTTRLWLEVMEDNLRARRFYARQGGRESSSFQEVFAGETLWSRTVTWDQL